MTNLLCEGSERSLSLRDDQMIVIQIVNNLKNTCTAEYNFVLAISSCCGLHCSNVCHQENFSLLSTAKDTFSGPTSSRTRKILARLLCRSCDRRITNFKGFQLGIRQNQASFLIRFKWLSP